MGYYVTLIRGKRVSWLAGPFSNHEDALERVPLAKRIACEVDPWCDFDAIGTTKLVISDGGRLPEGKLQSHIDHYEAYGVVDW